MRKCNYTNNNNENKNDEDYEDTPNNDKPNGKSDKNNPEKVTKTQLKIPCQVSTIVSNTNKSSKTILPIDKLKNVSSIQSTSTYTNTPNSSNCDSELFNSSSTCISISPSLASNTTTNLSPSVTTPVSTISPINNMPDDNIFFSLQESPSNDRNHHRNIDNLSTYRMPDLLPSSNVGGTDLVTDESTRLDDLTAQLRTAELNAERAEANARNARSEADTLRLLLDNVRESSRSQIYQNNISTTQTPTMVDMVAPVRLTLSDQLRNVNEPMNLGEDEGDDILQRMIMDMMNINRNFRTIDDMYANDGNNVDPFPFFVQHQWPMAQWPNEENNMIDHATENNAAIADHAATNDVIPTDRPRANNRRRFFTPMTNRPDSDMLDSDDSLFTQLMAVNSQSPTQRFMQQNGSRQPNNGQGIEEFVVTEYRDMAVGSDGVLSPNNDNGDHQRSIPRNRRNFNPGRANLFATLDLATPIITSTPTTTIIPPLTTSSATAALSRDTSTTVNGIVNSTDYSSSNVPSTSFGFVTTFPNYQPSGFANIITNVNGNVGTHEVPTTSTTTLSNVGSSTIPTSTTAPTSMTPPTAATQATQSTPSTNTTPSNSNTHANPPLHRIAITNSPRRPSNNTSILGPNMVTTATNTGTGIDAPGNPGLNSSENTRNNSRRSKKRDVH